MNLPKNPFILLSFINTKLRDCYSSLDSLVDDLDVSIEEINDILKSEGYYYNRELNQFK